MDKRKNLANALSKIQEKEIKKFEWDVFGKDYSATLTKLASLELGMKETIEEQKKIDAISKAQQEKGKNTKRDLNGKVKGEKPPCKICGKNHGGVCRYLKKPPGQGTPTYQEFVKFYK